MRGDRVLLGAMLTGLGVGCALVLRPFASALAWAVILVLCAWPIFAGLRRRVGPTLAATLMTVLFALAAALPVAIVATGGALDAASLNTQVQAWLAAGLPHAPLWLYRLPLVGTRLGDLWNSWVADLSAMFAFFKPYLGAAAAEGLSLLLGIAHAVVAIVFSLFIGFFLFLNGDVLHVRLRNIASRLGGEPGERMLNSVARTVRGTVYALLGMAAIEGCLTFIGLRIAEIGQAPLLALLAGLFSVLPIGAPLVWIPAALWLLAGGDTDRAIFLIIYGVLVISGADHLVRPWLIARGSRLPFLLTVLGVLGGAVAFGLVGLFLGPALLGAGYALAEAYSQNVPDAPEAAR